MHLKQEVISSTGLDISLPPQEELVLPHHNSLQLAWRDLVQGVLRWRVWVMLASQDIKLRYRRSLLGPFWITISMAITVYAMGFLYAHLFHVPLGHYYPFLVGGMLSWSLISVLIIELSDVFTAFDSYIKQIKLPFTVYIHRIIYRNFIIFFHNILVILPILFIYHDSIQLNLHTLMLLPGLALIYFNALSYGLIFGLLGARFRDIPQIIKSFVQVVFFVTPVMWSPEILGAKNHLMIDINPFYSFIQLIRAPLLGMMPTGFDWLMVGIVSVVGLLISASLFAKYRARIIYWL